MRVGSLGNPIMYLSGDWEIVWIVDVIGTFCPDPVRF